MVSHENRWNWKVKGEKELEAFGMLLLAPFHSGVTEEQQNVADKRTRAWRAESKFWIIATSCGSVFTSLQGSTKSQEVILLQIMHNSRQRPPLIPHTRCPQCKFFHLLLEWIVKLTTYKKDWILLCLFNIRFDVLLYSHSIIIYQMGSFVMSKLSPIVHASIKNTARLREKPGCPVVPACFFH